MYKIWFLKFERNYQPPYLFVVNVAFLQGASTTKIKPCFTPYTLKNQRHISKINWTITKRSSMCVSKLLMSYSSCYILISAVTVAGHDLQVLLNITLIIMSYSSCYILILAVTVAGHDLQVNICTPKYNIIFI